MSTKVLIIGAGPAGLTAAYKLLQQSPDYGVTILEESDTVGGISRTVFHNGNRMDIGGHRFFSKDADVNAMWQELMPMQGKPSLDDLLLNRDVALVLGGPDPEKEDRVMLSRNRVSRIYYKKHFFDYPIKMNFNTIRNMGLFTTFIAGMSYLKSIYGKLPESSLENFYINRFGRKLYSMFFEGYTEKLWGHHPNVISADWGAQRVKGLSIVAVLKDIISKRMPTFMRKNKQVETSLIEAFHYPKHGPGQLWEIAAQKIEKMGGHILLKHNVSRIIKNNGRIRQIVCDYDGSAVALACDIVISSMPLKELVGGMNDVPQKIADIAAGLPYRDFVTVGVLVDRLNLKNESKFKTLGNIIPDCWIYVQDSGVKLGRIQIFNNWSPYMVRDPQKNVWIGLEYFCSENDSFWNKNPEEWQKFGIAELKRIGVINEKVDIRDYHVEKVKKAYPAYFDTYAQIDTLIDYLNGIDNLYCVGRNGQHRYNNMDHSMVTSFETVRNIISKCGDRRDNIWRVNTEKEYHEEKKR